MQPRDGWMMRKKILGSERDFGKAGQTDRRQVGEDQTEVVRKQPCNGIFFFLFWHSINDQKNHACTDQPPPITTLHTNDRVQK